jgi:NAD(P)-dependent dehydrogenase (short-subunit alcohol dehydrogenase family)
VITGAAGDMGAALADSFLADGFTVFGADVTASVEKNGLVPVVVDVTDRDAVRALADRAAAESRLAVEAIRFLADPMRASYLNGVILPVNGGAYMPS